MKRTISLLAFLFVALLIIQACSKSASGTNTPTPGANTCTNVNAHFAADVMPIISGSCATQSSCHGSGSSNGPGELMTYNQIKSSAAAIKSAVEARIMPKTGSLSQTQINKISCWVSNGAKED